MGIGKTDTLDDASRVQLKIVAYRFIEALRNTRVEDNNNDRSGAALYREAKIIDINDDNEISASELAVLLQNDARAAAVAKTIPDLNTGISFHDAIMKSKSEDLVLKLKGGNVIIPRTSFDEPKTSATSDKYWSHPGETDVYADRYWSHPGEEN